MKLFYEREAGIWEETLPIGNGSLGAMVWGSVKREHLGLNEESLWSGYGRDKNNPSASGHLAEVRELIFEGSYEKAQKLLEEKMLGEFTECYLPLGDLYFEMNHSDRVTQYRRELNLGEAAVRVEYVCQGVRYTREYFASYPHGAILMRFTSSEPVLDMKIQFESQLHYQLTAEHETLYVNGQCPEQASPGYLQEAEPFIWGERGQRFQAGLQVLEHDGRLWAKEQQLCLQGAGSITMAFTFAPHPKSCPSLKELYQARGYDGIFARHREDYRALYSRVELYLGEQPEIPTDERLAALREGAGDESIYSLYFQYGRYLLISSSREGGMPANLQGIWNWQMQAPWSSNYTTNINLQMNYWPALTCNLAECMEPYFTFLGKLCENGRKTAREHYGCEGFSVAHNSDYWAQTNPVGVPFGADQGTDGCGIYAFFPLGGAWLCSELWNYYAYTNDRDFLRDQAYPITREAVRFCLDWLVEYGDYYVTCPSSSPENFFFIPGGEGKTASMIYACTMDMTIIRELFQNFNNMCQVLDVQDELLEEIGRKSERLYPYKTGRYGQLQEWPIDFAEAEPGHRHVSHLYGLFPAELFEADEELAGACRVSLERRLLNGGGHTGWSCGWIVNLFAILEDHDNVHEFLQTLLTKSTYPNLWDAHPPFQIDGNFGGTAAIANALVQDRGHGLKILPALPRQWQNGYVKGLCIKNDQCIDVYWENGELKDYQIYPNKFRAH